MDALVSVCKLFRSLLQLLFIICIAVGICWVQGIVLIHPVLRI